MKNIKRLLKKDQLSIGSWITIPDPIIVEMMCKSNFDWLAIDLEHSSISMESVQDILRIITSYGVFPFVRLTSNDSNQIKRVMDAGALGIIVPMVKTSNDIRMAHDAMYYPKLGKRSVGLARAQSYGRDLQDYMRELKEFGTLIVQIEHVEAVNNIKEIFSNKTIDGYIIGPNDLSASMGIPGDLKNKRLKDAIKHINEEAIKSAIPGGHHIIEANIKELSQAKKDGFKFIAYSLDIRLFDKALQEFMRSK
tara:strand:+ start:17615 stop:18367 length:753 start_codon:yes stop_codon:yes gene_type:complete